MTSLNQKLFSYIEQSPTAYHACAHTEKQLAEAGFLPLRENETWCIEKGKSYYVDRNGSSLIAFRVPSSEPIGFMVASAHSDSPCLKIKENADLNSPCYRRLSTEIYGGMLCSTWIDRPLSAAGRALVREKNGASLRLLNLKTPVALIPSVAIHLNRQANDHAGYNAAVDMLPLYGEGKDAPSFRARIAAESGVREEDLLSFDLYLYNPRNGYEWGEYISAPRLDDLQCAFAATEALLNARNGSSIALFALFDNEEVGNQTKQGGGSTFLGDCLLRIAAALNIDRERYRRMIADSFMVSCDNAHAGHPNHAEYADQNHTVWMNKGIVIKHNAYQRYTTDAVSSAIFGLICEKSGVPFQHYANRADMLGGTTLGSIATTRVPFSTVDIGLPQLAMHSSLETAGRDDTAYLVRALETLYSGSVRFKESGFELI